MAYTTQQAITDLTGQDYYDTALVLSTVVGTFQVGETVTGGTTSATATVTVVGIGYIEVTPSNVIITIGAESITGGTSGATATVTQIKTATKPSRAQIAAIIADADGEIDHILARNGVDVPITTGADLLKYLDNGARFYCAWQVEQRHYIQSQDNESRRGSEWKSRWLSFRDELRERPELINKPSRIAYSFPTTGNAVTSANQLK